MDELLVRLPLDLTGKNPENWVVDEAHAIVTRPGLALCILQLDHGGFYLHDLVVKDKDGQALKPREDYIVTFYYDYASTYTGYQVAGVIVITNPNIDERVYVSAHMVGGDFAVNLNAADLVYQYYRDNPDEPIQWLGYTGEPTPYPPGGLEDDLWALDGFESFNMAMEAYIKAILYGDQDAYQSLREYVSTETSDFTQAIAADLLRLREHIDDLENPHQSQARHVGLEKVANYPFAGDVASEPSPAETYAAPSHLTTLIDQYRTLFNDHIASTGNVHNETAAQVGTYDKATTDTLMAAKLGVTERAVNSRAVSGYSYVGLFNFVRRNLSGGYFTQGLVPPPTLGLGTPSANTVLRGDGRWATAGSVFESYSNAVGNNIQFIGYRGTINNALNHIRTTFSNIQQYPVGTVVFFRVEDQHTMGTGNGASTKAYQTMRAAVRRSNGWAIE